jgi:hypothetical protein
VAKRKYILDILPGIDLAKGVQAEDEIERMSWRISLGKKADRINGVGFSTAQELYV